jgi:DNA-binding CsgD family transcriptional regulator
MTVPVRASERDLRTLAGIVSGDRRDLPAEGLPLSLLSDLLDQIHCDDVSLFRLDSGRQEVRFLQYLPDDADDTDGGQVFWDHYWDCAPCNYPDRSGDLRSIIKISDFYSARQWHATGMYNDYFRPAGVEHELMLCLPPGPARTAGPGQSARLLLTRGPGPDFSERDRALLTLLRPHLYQAYLEAEHRRARTPELTPRQWELLHLVAAGHTNTQIARRLGLSEGTVRKHLENIYSRLQVSSRTAAVTCAFPSPAAVSA